MTRALIAGLVVSVTTAVSAQTPAVTIFKARAEAVARIDASRKNLTDPEARAEMALHWAEAMDRAARALPSDRGSTAEPYASWIRANRKYIVYDEPGGRWMLGRDTILNLHRMYPAMNAADDIAWLLVTVGIGGECEGDMACYVRWKDLTYGEYLRLHPKGRHADDAMDALRQWIEAVLHEPAYKKVFVPAEQCAELKTAIAKFRLAVEGSSRYRRQDIERGLDELLGWCSAVSVRQ